jgi:hypothetical protein
MPCPSAYHWPLFLTWLNFIPWRWRQKVLSVVGKYLPDYMASYIVWKIIIKEWIGVLKSEYGRIEVARGSSQSDPLWQTEQWMMTLFSSTLSVFTFKLLQRTKPVREFLSLSKCWWLPLMCLTFSAFVWLIPNVFLFQC